MYYLVQFIEDNIYEVCSPKDVKGRRQKICLAKWQSDRKFYPAKILVGGNKKIVRNLYDNLTNSLPRVLLDVNNLLDQTVNESYVVEENNILTRKDINADVITDGCLLGDYMPCSSHSVKENDLLRKKDGDIIRVAEKRLPREENIILDNIRGGANSIGEYVVCEKCSEVINESQFTSHNTEHNFQGRL